MLLEVLPISVERVGIAGYRPIPLGQQGLASNTRLGRMRATWVALLI
jgi:hypothetical protein